MATLSRRETEGLASYLRHLGGHKQLTREQEYELANRAKKGVTCLWKNLRWKRNWLQVKCRTG